MTAKATFELAHNEKKCATISNSNISTPKIETPDLKSLVASWSTLALVAVAATLYQLTHGHIDASAITNQAIDSFRTLQDEYTYDDHAALLPLTSSDWVGFVCAICGLMVAAGGGIGGGGILVPIYILVMGFSPKNAIPLANVTVFGGAVANTYLNSKKRHPLTDRPMVDWDLIMIMEPLTIAGALMGAFLNKLLREEVLVVMLVLLLSFTAYNTLKKATKMYKIESIHIAKEVVKESELAAISSNKDNECESASEFHLLDNAGGDVEKMEDVEMDPMLRMILEEEKTPPMRNIRLLVLLFLAVLTINILKGGGAFASPLGIECNGVGFWIANLIMIALVLSLTLYIRKYLIDRYGRKERCGYRYAEGDIRWDRQTTVLYPVICTLAGFFAGMFGVGGGIVKGPLMLAMGVHPKVASASSACMILFTSFTATSSFIVFGLLIHDYAVVCLILGFVATYFGQIILYYLMSKYERNSYIAFSIGGVVFLSALLMTIQSLVSMAEGNGKEPGGICGEG
eukprot:scaffold599_cov202-Chaetoceros_neogracile.AAC.4